MAEEGADIIAVDICQRSNRTLSVGDPRRPRRDRALGEGDRPAIVARVADVRERDELRDAVEAGIADLGKIDIVVANAGILPMAMGNPIHGFVDASDVDLVGVMNTVAVAIPHLPDGASIIVTGSTAGMIRGTTTARTWAPAVRATGGASASSWSTSTRCVFTWRRDDSRQRDPSDELQHPPVAE